MKPDNYMTHMTVLYIFLRSNSATIHIIQQQCRRFWQYGTVHSRVETVPIRRRGKTQADQQFNREITVAFGVDPTILGIKKSQEIFIQLGQCQRRLGISILWISSFKAFLFNRLGQFYFLANAACRNMVPRLLTAGIIADSHYYSLVHQPHYRFCLCLSRGRVHLQISSCYECIK